MSVISRDIQHHINKGLVSFADLIDFLHNEVSEVTRRSAQSIAPQVKLYVENLYLSFYRAKQACEARVDGLQREIEEIIYSLTCQKETIQRIKNQIEDLKIKERELVENEKLKNQYLSDCTEILRNKERSLEKAREKLSEAEEKRNIMAAVGVGVSVIPFVGWVVGPTMIFISLTALQDNVKSSKESVDCARSTRDNSSRELKQINSELGSIRKQMSTISSKLASSNTEKRRKKTRLQENKMQLQREVELQEQLNYIYTFVSTAFGRARHLRNSTKHFYSIEQLCNPMKELANHFISPNSAVKNTLQKNFRPELKKLQYIDNHVSISVDPDLVDYC